MEVTRTAGLFFDDDPTNIKNMNDNCNLNITSFLVNRDPILFFDNPESYTNFYADDLNNSYAKMLKTMNVPEKYRPTQGITQVEINIINEWIENTRDIKNRFIIFDWDRTLSACEGFIPLNEYLYKSINHYIPTLHP